jgi:hypothetical protein
MAVISSRRRMAATFALAATLATASCGSSSTGTAGTAPTPSGSSGSTAPTSPGSTSPGSTASPGSGATPTPGTQVSASMRGARYCEVLLVTVVDGQASAEVFNSYPLNDCPAERWTKLDAKAIAASEQVTVAVLNGPRYWLMDHVEKVGGVAGLEKKDFGGIAMYRQASVDVGSLADAMKPYTAHEVSRATVFTFDAGQTIYELTAADGTRYVMQTWSQQRDATLAEADLLGLASRLQLPAGWRYSSRTLTAPMRVVTTSTPAHVLQDDLGNSYSQETED